MHPKKEIRAALKVAKKAGWIIKKSNARAHAWGKMYCQFGHEKCWKLIYSTPRNPTYHARNLVKAVQNCPGDNE